MLAGKLDRLNRERRRLTADLQARSRQIAASDIQDSPLIFIADSEYPIGIIGLVAGRLADEFYRPAIVVDKGETASRGSARSILEFHITDALDQCSDLLIRYGGHAGAAGFTVANKNLGELVDRLRALAADQLANVELAPVLAVDAEVELSQMSWELQHELAQLEPFGYGNRQPLFLSRGVRVHSRRVVGTGGRHLKLALLADRVTWDAIAFRQGEWVSRLPERIDIVYHFEVNEWNGRRRLQLNVQDIRPTEQHGAIEGPWPGEDRTGASEDQE